MNYGEQRRLEAQIAFLRANWRNDGAEGDSVHAVCRALENLLAQKAWEDPGVVSESSPTPEQARASLEEEEYVLPFCASFTKKKFDQAAYRADVEKLDRATLLDALVREAELRHNAVEGALGPPIGVQAEPRPEPEVRWGICEVGAEEDGFRGSFFTREEAIAEGRLQHGSDDFLIGMGYSPDPATYMPPVEDLLERAAESASDEAGESAEDWPDVTLEAEIELSDFLASWARRHAPCSFWVLDHFERVAAKPSGMTEPPPHTD